MLEDTVAVIEESPHRVFIKRFEDGSLEAIFACCLEVNAPDVPEILPRISCRKFTQKVETPEEV